METAGPIQPVAPVSPPLGNIARSTSCSGGRARVHPAVGYEIAAIGRDSDRDAHWRAEDDGLADFTRFVHLI